MIINSDGEITYFKEEDLKKDGTIKYGTIKEALEGGTLAGHSTILPSVIMYVDDNGLHKKLPLNPLATVLYAREHPVVGTVILTWSRTEDDEPLNEEQRKIVLETKNDLFNYLEGEE